MKEAREFAGAFQRRSSGRRLRLQAISFRSILEWREYRSLSFA